MDFLGAWTLQIWKVFPHMVEYKTLRENSTSILEREIKPWTVYRNVKECILEANL